MSSTRVQVDPNVCQSAGYCMRTAPTVFAADADGIVALRSGSQLSTGPMEIPEGQAELVDRAAWDCPAAAITIS